MGWVGPEPLVCTHLPPHSLTSICNMWVLIEVWVYGLPLLPPVPGHHVQALPAKERHDSCLWEPRTQIIIVHRKVWCCSLAPLDKRIRTWATCNPVKEGKPSSSAVWWGQEQTERSEVLGKNKVFFTFQKIHFIEE